MNPDPLIDIALRVTDGAPVNWASAARDLPSTEGAALERLRQLEALACVHATIPTETGALDSISLWEEEHSGAPRRWGSLEILEKIGSGAYGDVYRARDTRLDREVALKLLRRREATPEADVVREGQLLARVRHPNVVTVYGAERIEGRTGVWMELLRGETLEQELRRRGRFSAPEILQVALDLCSAVAAVHAAGLLHRDIKAQNVIRAEDGRLVLMDFGTGSESQGTSMLAGTPAYLAPEVLAGAKPGAVSEVYALGVLLFRLATGAFPIEGTDIRTLERAHQERKAPSVRTLRGDLPRALSAAIDRALDPTPAVRHRDVAQFRQALLLIRSRPRLTASVLIIGAAALGVVMLAGAVLMHSGGRERRRRPDAVTLTQIPVSIQRRFNIRAPAWEGSLVTCTPHEAAAVSVCDLADGSIRAVKTPASDRERAPVAYLSPDGRRLVYLWVVDANVSVRVIDADGSNDRELLGPSESVLSVTGWNRASDAVVFTAADGKDACTRLLEVATGARHTLRCEAERNARGRVALSPDDRYVASARPRTVGGAPEDLWILDRVTGSEYRVSTDVSIDRDPLWTPDGTALTFVSNRLGTWGLFSMRVVDGRAVGSPELVRDLGRSMPQPLGFRRDGTLFLYTMTDLEDVLRTQTSLELLSLGTPGRAAPTALDESNRSPDWSPDGRRFAFIAGAWRGDARIVIASAEGGIERHLTFPGMPSVLGKVRWSPDGQMLAVTAASPDNGQASVLDLVALQNGHRRRLLSTDRIVDLRWAPDSRSIVFLSTGALHSVDLTTAISREIYRPEKPWMIDRFATFDLSRNGTAVVAIRSPGVVPCAARIITATGNVRDLPSFASECRAIAWTHDERAVLASVHQSDGAIPILMVDAAGGAPPVLLRSPRIQVVDISTNPDGHQMLVGSGNPRPDFWALSGFTPALN